MSTSTIPTVKLGQPVHLRNHVSGACAPAVLYAVGESGEFADLVVFPSALIQRGVIHDADPRPAHPTGIEPTTGKASRRQSWHDQCPEGR
jgi:hypothetical protein